MTRWFMMLLTFSGEPRRQNLRQGDKGVRRRGVSLRLAILPLPIALLCISVPLWFSLTWADENLLFKREVGFSPNRISWVHLPDFYSQPHSESGIDLDGDNIIDLFVFLPEYPTDRVKAFFNNGSFAWEYQANKQDQPKRELGAFALAAFDTDSDGVKEVICGTNDLRLYALDAFSGLVKKEMQLKYGCYVYSMTVGNVTGDGSSELMVACSGNAEWQRGHTRLLPKSRGYIHALDEKLEPLWHTPLGDVGVLFGHYVFAGDLDGDGREEVMVPDLSGNFYLFDDDGRMLWTKSVKEIAPERTASHVDYALIADVDGDPENGSELVIAAEESGGCLYNRDGQLLWRTKRAISHAQHCAVADVRYHKKGSEILFFDKTGERVLLFTSYGEKLWERDIGYMAVMGGFIDWTGDETKEIIAAAGECVLIYDEYGRLVERMSAPSLLSHDGMIANVAGDGREEYIAITEDEFFVFSNPQPAKKKDTTANVEGDQRGAYITGDEFFDLVESPKLLQNFPNPFSIGTYIPYILPEQSSLEVNIYSSRGRLVRILNIEDQEPGFHAKSGEAAYWDGRNETGEDVVYGIYFYSIKGDYSVTL